MDSKTYEVISEDGGIWLKRVGVPGRPKWIGPRALLAILEHFALSSNDQEAK